MDGRADLARAVEVRRLSIGVSRKHGFPESFLRTQVCVSVDSWDHGLRRYGRSEAYWAPAKSATALRKDGIGMVLAGKGGEMDALSLLVEVPDPVVLLVLSGEMIPEMVHEIYAVRRQGRICIIIGPDHECQSMSPVAQRFG